LFLVNGEWFLCCLDDSNLLEVNHIDNWKWRESVL